MIEQTENTLAFKSEFEKVRQEGYSVELSDTLSEGWKLVQRNIGLLIGFCIVAFLIIIFSSLLLSFIPIIGGFVNTAFVIVVLAGFYTFFMNYHKNKFASFSDFFESFQDAVQIGLYGLISTLISYIPAIILGVIIGIIIAVVGIGAANLDFFEGLQNGDIDSLFASGALFITIFIIGLIIMIPVILISMLYMFAPLIIITQKREFWSAMELSRKLVMKNFSGNVGLLLVLGIINIIASIPLGLGLLITVPLSYACIFVLYIKLLQKNGEDTGFGSNFYGDEKAPLDAF